jgi:hypothetical protein
MLKNKQTMFSALVVAMAFGTAWAVRGKFGHEQGAAWAGAIGAFSVVLVGKRTDWYKNIFKIGLAGAVGWGLSGMISYGQLVGYGRAADFLNAYYGLLMLFVIGVLYGIIGGGLFGLALADSKTFKVKWASVITQMIAFALLTYGLLVNQLEWLMTPPRSELWAACLGASIALLWYIIRNKQDGVLRVAIWSALGAGFGFAFGNFLQVLGATSALKINFWNVMEYSIGFFGGLGMAYGTLTSSWPEQAIPENRTANLVPILLIAVFIPFVLWDQSFVTEKLDFIIKEGGTSETVFIFQILAALSIALYVIMMLSRYFRSSYTFSDVRSIFLISLGVYTFLSFLLTGIYVHPIEQYLYLVNIAVILFLVPSISDNFELVDEPPWRSLVACVLSIVLIGVFALIAINSHGVIPGAGVRFK